MKNKRARADLVDEEKQEREIQRQIERAEQMMETVDSVAADEKNEEGNKSRMMEKNKEDADKNIKLRLGSSAKNAHEKKDSSKFLFDEEEFKSKNGKVKKQNDDNKSVKNESALDELMKEEEKAKERSNRKDNWLFEGIVVKVMSKALTNRGYYKQKGL